MSNYPHPDITRIDIRRRPDGVFLGIIRPAHRQYYKEFEAPTWEAAAEQIRVFLQENQLSLTETPQP
jgi:hypothetical protein